jgi:hypothetical protein
MASRNFARCARDGQPISADILAILATMFQQASEMEAPTLIMSSIAYRMINLAAGIRSGAIHIIDDILADALQLDNEYEALLESMPLGYAYNLVSNVTGGISSLERTIQIHPDFRTALVWNSIRSCRILVNEMIVRQIRKITTPSNGGACKHDFIASRSAALIDRMALDILATVPQQAGLLSEDTYVSDKAPDVGTEASEATGAGRATYASPKAGSTPTSHSMELESSAYSILWPLYVVGRCPDTTILNLRNRIVDAFKSIAARSVIPQALSLADFLQAESSPGVWAVYEMLGSYSRMPKPR